MGTAGLNHWGDIVALVLYFMLTMGIAIWIGLSLFASNISSEHLVGLAGAGAASGIAVVVFEWGATFHVLLLAWAFLPVYLVSGVYTLPEYLYKRFGRHRLRLLVSILLIMRYVFTPDDLYSGGLFIQQALGWNLYAGIFLIIVISAIFSICGGLATVMYTDAVQVFIMIIGTCVVTVIGFQRIGGFAELRYKYMHAVASTVLNATNNDTNASSCGYPREDAWHIFRDPVYADYPSVGLILRVSVIIFYWCANQVIVQRALAAKNISHAKAGAVLAAFLKVAPLFMMIIPGMISRVLFPDEVGCVDPDVCMEVCGSHVGCTNIAYPKLILGILPVGFRGLMLAVMLSAVVSSLTSVYNSVATMMTIDLWVRLRPRASPRELLIVGRLSVLIVVGVSVAWVPILKNADGGQLFKYVTTVIGYIWAPFTSTFLLAIFWTRVNETGAFWGFLLGAIPGLVRFILDSVYTKPACGQLDTRPAFLRYVHPYYSTILQLVIGLLTGAVVSLLTEPIPRHKLGGLTFWTLYDKPFHKSSHDEEKQTKLALVSKKQPDTNKQIQNDSTVVKTSFDIVPDEDISFIDNYKDTESKRCRCPQLTKRLTNAFCVGDEIPPSEVTNPEESYEERISKLHQSFSNKLILNILAVLAMSTVVVLCIYFR